MEDLAGTAGRVTPERHQADEWAVVLAAGNIPHRLHPVLDGWARIVAARDAEAAREALDAYDRENIADTADVGADAVAPVRGAAVVGVAVGLLLVGFFAVTGTRASHSTWFERGGADAERIVAGEWWRTVTALTLPVDATRPRPSCGWSARRVSPCSLSSARARAPTSSPICSGSCSAAPWASLLRPRCGDLCAPRCSGRSQWPSWRRRSARGYALSPETTPASAAYRYPDDNRLHAADADRYAAD